VPGDFPDTDAAGEDGDEDVGYECHLPVDVRVGNFVSHLVVEVGFGRGEEVACGGGWCCGDVRLRGLEHTVVGFGFVFLAESCHKGFVFVGLQSCISMRNV